MNVVPAPCAYERFLLLRAGGVRGSRGAGPSNFHLIDMATKCTNPRKDFTQIALSVVQQATGEVSAPAPTKKQGGGRKGGLKGDAVRAKTVTAEQRSAIVQSAAAARWKGNLLDQAQVSCRAIVGRDLNARRVSVESVELLWHQVE